MWERFKTNSGLSADPDWRRFVLRWLGASLILHLLAAWFSSGFYHSDEHFQILEFLNFRMGKSPAADLPIEFHERMRPWLQPAIYYGLVKVWSALGIQSPFTWALGFRKLSALLGWLGASGLALCCHAWIRDPRWRKVAVVGLALIWYLPAFHARLSSENLSGSVFVLGLTTALLFSEVTTGARRLPAAFALWTGILFGAAFEFRYQTGLMVAGAWLWFLLIGRVGPRTLAVMLAGIAIAVAAGTLADRWGYGAWGFAPWNYVRFNLLQGHVGDVDSSPWWDFFRRAFTETWPPLGFLLLASFPVAWFRNLKHPLTWASVPLFLAHELIGHKELRFLFPLVHAGPVLFVLAFYSPTTGRLAFERFWQAGLVRVTSKILLVINSAALLTMTLLPAWMPIRFLAELYQRSPLEFFYKDQNPYHIAGIPLNFYRPPGITPRPLQSYLEFEARLSADPLYLFYYRSRLPEEAGALRGSCRPEFQSLPSVVEAVNPFGIADRLTNWTLFRCQR